MIKPRVSPMYHPHVSMILPGSQRIQVILRIFDWIFRRPVQVSSAIFGDVFVGVHIRASYHPYIFSVMNIEFFRVVHLPRVILLVTLVTLGIPLIEILNCKVLSEELKNVR